MFHKAGSRSTPDSGDSRIAIEEPTPAQREDSVLRRDLKGSVLTSLSATYVFGYLGSQVDQYCGAPDLEAPEAAQPRLAAILLRFPHSSQFSHLQPRGLAPAS